MKSRVELSCSERSYEKKLDILHMYHLYDKAVSHIHVHVQLGL